MRLSDCGKATAGMPRCSHSCATWPTRQFVLSIVGGSARLDSDTAVNREFFVAEVRTGVRTRRDVADQPCDGGTHSPR
jgi:hypothetical protein